MIRTLATAFVDYHRGLALMPVKWKPWLGSLFVANMVIPLFFMQRLEARVVFLVALIHGAMFVCLTAASGFSRLLGLAHILWFPMIAFLFFRLDLWPPDAFYGLWIRAVIVLDAGSLILDATNVVRYIAGEREEMVAGLTREVK